uniref:Aminomethyltransferase folate-binding domain-containing protein n=1 Tax=Anopheles epiroticus TaxID=199890 RepID=A0A182PLY4_9DIPT
MLLGRFISSAIYYPHRKWPAALRQNRTLVNSVRRLHQSNPVHGPFTLAALTERKFVRVQGTDSVSFLQGLMTNDMRHFEHSGTVYAMFLRANGRVFCDTLLYKRPGATEQEPHDYLLECDVTVAPRLEKHLKLYRLRKKVQVTLDETYRVWAAFKPGTDESDDSPGSSNLICPEGRLHVFKDPRLPRLGYRVLSSEQQVESKEPLLRIFPGAELSADTAVPYTVFRYSLGVGEGEENLPDGKCFPLECNCDLLHGVSFHKGCYIGQELTARTYHTGVIRKRLMPLVFDEPPMLTGGDSEAMRDAEIKNEEGSVVGKLRGLVGNRGIGLLRIEKVLPEGKLTLHVAETGSSSVATETHPLIPFRCDLCGLNENCDYRGRRPPFASKIEFPEECYVMRDPFAPPPQAAPDKPSSEYYLLLGADCNLCQRTVCKATECSFFYGATFCRRCSLDRVQEFPLE